jgi:hypothetical protein
LKPIRKLSSEISEEKSTALQDYELTISEISERGKTVKKSKLK